MSYGEIYDAAIAARELSIAIQNQFKDLKELLSEAEINDDEEAMHETEAFFDDVTGLIKSKIDEIDNEGGPSAMDQSCLNAQRVDAARGK